MTSSPSTSTCCLPVKSAGGISATVVWRATWAIASSSVKSTPSWSAFQVIERYIAPVSM
ncbi:hypothetical protein D3C72_2550290 [compost metagenome]